MNGLEHWNSIIDEHPVLTSDEEVALASERDEEGRVGEKALEKLILHNLRAVVERVEAMRTSADKKHDLMSAGVLGLRKAAVKWKPMEGARFYHYAYMWIREAVVKEAKATWHDHQSFDAPVGDGEADGYNINREETIGLQEDERIYLSAEVLQVLTDRERQIVESRLVHMMEETDEELAHRLGVKPLSVLKMLHGSIRKLMAQAA